MANVQISEELFLNLVKYHLCGLEDFSEPIQKGLQEKLDKIVERNLYTQSKTADTVEEREKARLEYLDRKGISEKFRW